MPACWPACSPWCNCDTATGQCSPSPVVVNALRLRTPDGRYLQAVNGGPGGLVASTGAPAQAATFYFTPLPKSGVLASGDLLSLEVCDSSWGHSGFFVRVDHTVVTKQGPKEGPFKQPVNIVTYEIGGPGAGVWVKGPWSAGYPAYPGDNPTEKTFALLKAGGGPIGSSSTGARAWWRSSWG